MAETASRWKGKGKSVFTSRLRKRASAAPEEDDANNNNNDKSAAKVEHSKALEANNNEKQKKKSQSQRTSPRVRIKEPEEASGQGVVVATSQQKTKRDASFLRRKFSRVLHSKASSSTSISTSREASAGPSSPRKAAAEPLFGVPLEVAALRSDPERGLVPSPLANAIAWLNKYGLKEKGLYRIPGSQTTFQHYKDMFDRGENVDFEALEEKVVENVAIVVIKYFKELPHSMFSSRLRPDFEVAAGITDEEEQLVKLKHIFPKMPLAFKETFRLLATHFNLIAEHAETNQMKPSVLGMTWGITFGPAVGNIVAVLAAHPVDELIPPSIVFGVELSEAAKRSDPEGLIPSPIRLPFALLHEQGCSEDVFRDGNADADALKQWKTVFNSEGAHRYQRKLFQKCTRHWRLLS
ncbi:SLIT-ROBO Rho GTPase-activating protein 3 [Balamuthia mandrillaris]